MAKTKRPPRTRGNGYGGPAKKCQCGKNWYPTLESCRAARWRIGAHRPQGSALYYQCKYGSWHWTRKGVPEAVRIDGAPRSVNAEYGPDHHETLEAARTALAEAAVPYQVTFYQCPHGGYHYTAKGQPPEAPCHPIPPDDDTAADEDD